MGKLGIRAGGFPLQWKYLHPIYEFDGRYLWQDDEVTETVAREGKIVAGLMRIYADTRDEYVAFITPECWEAIQLYREKWVQEVGREPKPNDPFFKQAGFIIRPLSKSGIYERIDRILRSAGYRKPLPKGVKRHEIPIFNGFRRFFNKANKKSFSKNSVLASLILKENMMGHEGLIQLDKNYFKEHVSELIEEYLTSIPNLTISDEERQRIIIEQNTRKLTEYEKNQAYAESLEKKLEDTRIEFMKQIEDLKAGIEANKQAVEQEKPTSKNN